jgi:hypothetical protein
MPRLINLMRANGNLFALAAASTTHASAYGLNGEDGILAWLKNTVPYSLGPQQLWDADQPAI